ncbi:IS5 family transposase [Hoeflea sp. G2-23]|uniref:IS5 family transposase n=1 Tax=Hoeflea algicola TaxID=2983763 RepID=A0ABT3ZDF6_9HYPH|nr:IS5 family transposase [Hoeflea algicola]MCY0149639.1 IS5 family transposase [Hoeflea algicola]MCY0149816.1 IS5 family transposase [Hoeflea algicola]MCY0150828.1 IS5 family transposase [Hoeflea algicola]
MWTKANRGKYNRDGLRYPSDLTDAEWALVEPLIPPAKRGGRRREVNVREVLNGLLYVLSTGCQWRAVPKDLPPKSTLFSYFDLWNWDGTLGRIHQELYVKCREAMGREASPTAAVIDSQSVKGAEKGGFCIDPSGYDAGKKVKGKKRHILVDTVGLLLHALVHPADIQDRDGGLLVIKTLFGRYPFLKKLFADGGYQGPVFAKGQKKAMPGLAIKIIKRSDIVKGFEVLPRRWVVERTFAWLGRCRRLAKDFENLSRNALAFLKLASIRLMLRRLCSK